MGIINLGDALKRDRDHLFYLSGSVVKKLPAKAWDIGSIPGSGRSPGKGNGNPLQYSCLGNPRGAWEAIDSSVLAWRIPGTGEPHGLPSLGPHRSDTTEAT